MTTSCNCSPAHHLEFWLAGFGAFLAAENEERRAEIAYDLYLAAVRYVQTHVLSKARDDLLEQAIDLVLEEFSEYDLYYRSGKHIQGLLWTKKPLTSYARDPRLLESKLSSLVRRIAGTNPRRTNPQTEGASKRMDASQFFRP